MDPEYEARSAARRMLLTGPLWAVVSVVYVTSLIAVGPSGTVPSHLLQILGPVLLVAAWRDLSIQASREVFEGNVPWLGWALTLAILFPGTLGAIFLLVVTLG